MTARPRTREDSVSQSVGTGALSVVAEPGDEVAIDMAALKEQIRQELLAEIAAGEVQIPEPVEDPTAPRIVHILEDGFTAFGKVWYRGQEITVVPESDEWNSTVDRDGNTWMNLSYTEQEIRYGRQMFGKGHWPYGGFNLDDPLLTDEEREILQRTDLKRRQRSATPGVTNKK